MILFLREGANTYPETEPFLFLTIFEVGSLALIFALLGLWAKSQPLIPSIIGLILYVGYNQLGMVLHPELIGKGVVFMIIVVIALVKIVVTAAKA
jgi:hypothetical protein